MLSDPAHAAHAEVPRIRPSGGQRLPKGAPVRERSDSLAGQPGPLAAGPPRPILPRLSAHSLYRLHRLLAPNAGYRRLAAVLAATPWLYRLFTAGEKRVKEDIFGCRMCGQCAIPLTGYACPMTCPKQLRNGPCGGVGRDGSCEVYPASKCVWLVAVERADSAGKRQDLLRLHRPIDHRRWGQSSWISYWQGRDEGLSTDDDGLAEPAAINAAGWLGHP
jgi:hypothetical protein